LQREYIPSIILTCYGGFFLDKNKVCPGKILSIARREYNGLLLEKTFVLSLLVQLFIASFSAFLVVGLTSFYDPMALQGMQMKESKIGVIGDAKENSSN
jgi:hypothetical protein